MKKGEITFKKVKREVYKSLVNIADSVFSEREDRLYRIAGFAEAIIDFLMALSMLLEDRERKDFIKTAIGRIKKLSKITKEKESKLCKR